MPPCRLDQLAVAVACALPALALSESGLGLRSQQALLPVPAKIEAPVPVFIDADRIEGTQDRETIASGKARLRKRGQAFHADWMKFDSQSEVISAKGDVRIEQRGELLEGSELRYETATDRGFLEKPRYWLMSRRIDLPGGEERPGFGELDGRGTAERLLFAGPGKYEIRGTEYTTCAPGNNSWFIRAAKLDIDRDRNIGEARDANIVFFDRTIFYSPYLTFSLHQERQSGFLTPTHRRSNTTGFEVIVPYYWNIAPNMDATFYPRYMTKRGLQIGSEFRYLQPGWKGEMRAEDLPSDQQVGRDRWGFFAKHQQALWSDWNGTVNINRVSDDRYFTDLSTLLTVTSRVHLNNDLSLSRTGRWDDDGFYQVGVLAQRWRTLQADLSAPLTPPYNRLPQISLLAQKQHSQWGDFDFSGANSSFEHQSLVNGNRTVVYPAWSYPMQTSYAYLTPKVGAHLTHYALGANNTARLPDANRSLPVFSLDSGVTFERNLDLGGRQWINTLEPRAYYVYIPYRNQSLLPNFDSSQQDVNLATIFSENQFSGQDRINDANQLTMGGTTRLVDSSSGSERLRAVLAQRFYFQSQQVTLPGVAPRAKDSNSSDLLAAVRGYLARNWFAEAGWQYNTDQKQTQRFNVAARYQPRQGQTLNVAYRENVNLLRQMDVSAQWPIDGRWTVVGRWNHSLRDNRNLEALAGFEYSDQCWALRIVAHRFATTSSAASTSVFVQLELNGVSRIGSNPLDVLKRSITGYRPHDPRAGAPVEYNVPGLF